jgi:hypothetical protein
MARKITRKQFHLSTLAALALLIGASFIAAPARADHDDGPNVGFHFFFGLPFPFPPPPPPVVVYGPPPVYYYEPAPRVVIRERPYYRDWYYHERPYPSYEWRNHRHRARPHYGHDDD